MLAMIHPKCPAVRMTALLAVLTFISGPQALAGAAFDAAEANNRFAWAALSALQSENPGEDLVFSPYSIHLAMGMAYAGARGETAAEMEAVLGYGGHEATHPGIAALAAAVLAAVEDDRAEVGIANRVWADAQWPLEQTYIERLAAHYGSGVERGDFRSEAGREFLRGVINEWVEGETFERIPELIPEEGFTDLTRWVLVNALAFRAPFEQPFHPEVTTAGSFHVSPGETMEVRMMSQDGAFPYGSNEWAEVVALPLAGGSFSFVVLLPREGRTPTDVVTAMDGGKFALDDELFGRSWPHGTRILLSLPRFQVKWDEELKSLFETLGMAAAFDPMLSDFSGMAPVADNYIHRVDHSAFLQCVEGGIEAAAATAVIGGPTSLPPVVTFDRPFVFALREDTSGTILFAGQVVRPENPPDKAPDWRERVERALGGPLKPVGDGPWHDSAFGRIEPTRYPWVRHEALGWGQLAGRDGRLWFWHAGGLGWMWTDLDGAYPVFHIHGREDPWVYLDKAAPGGPALWDFVGGRHIPFK